MGRRTRARDYHDPGGQLITPLLPLHIFGIFLDLTYTGDAWTVMRTLLRVVVVVLVLELVILSVQYAVAGAVGRKNPVRALGMMDVEARKRLERGA